MRVYQHTLTDDVLRLAERLRSHFEILRSYPEEGIEVTDEQLEMVVGGVLSAEDIAYCQQAVEDYRLETGDRLVTSTPLSFQMETLGSTIDGHPNRDSNKLAAETLTNFLWQTSLGTSY